jgi:hypothetical protein
MNTQNLAKIKEKVTKEATVGLSWKDNLSIQHLLDVVSSVLATEYIITAKQNPDVFLKHGDPK